MHFSFNKTINCLYLCNKRLISVPLQRVTWFVNGWKESASYFLTTMNHGTVFGTTGFWGGGKKKPRWSRRSQIKTGKRTITTVNLSCSQDLIEYRRVQLSKTCTILCRKESNHTCVSISNLNLALQYLLCSRFPVCPCHHPHPSHLSPCKLSCQKATRLAYACLLDSTVSGER